MKIAFVPQPLDMIFPPMQSSIGIWTYELAQRLAHSCEVIVYTGRGRKKVQFDKGVQYRHLSPTFDRWSLRLLKRFSGLYSVTRPLFASGLYYWGYALQVANDLRKHQCDIVHIHNLSQFVPIIRAFNPKIKIVLHMHCEWLTQLDAEMIQQRLNQVDWVVGCSEYVTKKIHFAFPQIAARCQVAHNGVDAEHFCRKNGNTTTRKPGAKRLLYIGRVSPEKGLHVLVEALGQVAKRHPEAQLEIVGPEAPAPVEYMVALSDDPKVSALAQFYGKSYLAHLHERIPPNLSRYVTFFGPLPYAQLINRYCDAELFIFPSVCHEPFGMPIIEAMACELPIVATRGGGITEIVEEGKSGLLVERGDATALAEAISLLLSNENLRRTMAKTARRRVLELFSWDRIAENLLCTYKNIEKNPA